MSASSSTVDSSPIRWEAIESFIGFGRADAPVLFLGMEEGLCAGADLEDELRARSGYGRYEDLSNVQTPLGVPGRFFGANPKSQRTWRPMCHLMLRRAGVSDAITNEMRCRYQADRLGRSDGETLLAELLPYPNPNTATWLYESFGRNGRSALLEDRIALLRNGFTDAPFEIVVAYGAANWQHYQRVFELRRWDRNGAFLVGRRGPTRVVLAPHVATRAFNTHDQLDVFADICLTST